MVDTEIMLAILKSRRRYGAKVVMSMAMCDAKILHEAVESGKTIDQKTILTLLSQRNTGQLSAILSSSSTSMVMNSPCSLSKANVENLGENFGLSFVAFKTRKSSWRSC